MRGEMATAGLIGPAIGAGYNPKLRGCGPRAQAALAAGFARVASSSNALEMSRMLMTPTRL